MAQFNFPLDKGTSPRPPCKGCPIRKVGCHESCLKWHAYEKLKEQEEYNRKIKFYGAVL